MFARFDAPGDELFASLPENLGIKRLAGVRRQVGDLNTFAFDDDRNPILLGALGFGRVPADP